MAIQDEPLALKFAPELYYTKTENPLKNTRPEDMGGLYWQSVPSLVSWADTCIQYIVYFRQQRWIPSILITVLEKFPGELGKLPGHHPNDYAPIFFYFKNGKLIRAVFDVCHYEAVGIVDASSGIFSQDVRPKFQVENFYRGLSPLKDCPGLTSLKALPTPLSPERLTDWWKGLMLNGFYDESARLIIREKLKNPFQEITTFRDHESKYGDIFHWIFWLARKEYRIRVKDEKINTDAIASQVEAQTDDIARYFSHEEIKELADFLDQNIFKELGVPQYLALRKGRRFQRV